MEPTLVDIQTHPRRKFDIWIGRSNRTHRDDRLRHDYQFAAPYHRHCGKEDWRKAACDHYRKHLRAELKNIPARKRFLQLRGKRLGVWGEFGLMTGQVVLDMLKELQKDK